ncbi:MAG: hypothetical protein HGA82_01535 [Anaerolineales bacterium]|nr:hypothetical protein [Anaerolineales bacterium]
MRRACIQIIILEGAFVAKMYLGNWSDYETMMQEKFGKDLPPHRVSYWTVKR